MTRYQKPPKTIVIDSPVFDQVQTIEDILCMTTLFAGGLIDYPPTLEKADAYYHELGVKTCDVCPMTDKCLACVINE